MIGDRLAQRVDPLRRVRFAEEPLSHDIVDVVRTESELLRKAIREDPDTRTGLMESTIDIIGGFLAGDEQKDFAKPYRLHLLSQDLKLGDPVHVVAQVQSYLVKADEQSTLLGMDGLRFTDKSPHNFLWLGLLLLGQPNRIRGQFERLVSPGKELEESLNQQGMGEGRIVSNLGPLPGITVAGRRLGHERAKVLVLVVLLEQLLELGDPRHL